MATPRIERRRLQTRDRLIDAAQALIGERGLTALRVGDITDRADVALGSFYVHFDTKEAIVEAVVEAAVTSVADAIAAGARTLEDPAEILSVGARRLIGLCQSDPGLARLLVGLGHAETRFDHIIWPHALPVMQRGIARGRFIVADRELALTISIAAVLATIRGTIDGRLDSTAASACAVALLRSVGLSLEEADEIANKPLPSLDLGSDARLIHEQAEHRRAS
jgi:AcrR family transcriptional regulator